MKTGDNKATNNFLVRVWSKSYYNENTQKYITRYDGNVTEVKSKEVISFHTPAQFLKAIEDLNKRAEKVQRNKK